MKLQCDDWQISARVDLTIYSPADSAELLLEADSVTEKGHSILTIQHRTMLCGERIAGMLNELFANVKADMEPHAFMSMLEKVLR